MEEYPTLSVLRDGYSEELMEGIEHMQASDGTYKSHILYVGAAYTASFVHPLITGSQYDRLIMFYRSNRAKEFMFTSPLGEQRIVARFARRPLIIDRLRDRYTVQVNLMGRVDEQ